MKDDEHLEIIGRYLSGEMTEAEQKAFFLWLTEHPGHKLLFEEINAVWQLTGEIEEDFEPGLIEAWAAIDKKVDLSAIPPRQSKKSGKVAIWRPILSVAAIFAIVGLGLWWYTTMDTLENTQVQYQTGPGEKLNFTLPDSSRLWLNSNSTLAYKENFDLRHVQLSGEAYFEVTPQEDRPFSISSGKAQTVVLGTSFNVRAYPDESLIELTVQNGKVAFSSSQIAGHPIIVTAGEFAVLDKKENSIVKSKSVSQNATSWKSNQLNFDHIPMDAVISTLERHFGISIKVENPAILQCPFKGDFTRGHLNLDTIFEAIEFALGIKVNKNNNIYTLNGEGCK